MIYDLDAYSAFGVLGSMWRSMLPLLITNKIAPSFEAKPSTSPGWFQHSDECLDRHPHVWVRS